MDEMNKYVELLNDWKRTDGKLTVISPEEPVQTRRGFCLYVVSDSESREGHWRIMRTLLEEKEVKCPKFRIKEHRESLLGSGAIQTTATTVHSREGTSGPVRPVRHQPPRHNPMPPRESYGRSSQFQGGKSPY